MAIVLSAQIVLLLVHVSTTRRTVDSRD